jgi:septal ring factor EnvC (AmiA/AmiB activator)
MDFASFLNTDNLYKFLFSGGILMIVFSLFYPIEKKQLLELEINNFNKQTELLNNDISLLNVEVNQLKSTSKETLKTIEKLQKTKSDLNQTQVSKEISNIKDNYNRIFYKIKSHQQETILKNINIKYNKTKIEIIQNHISTFSFYSLFLLIFGILFAGFGLRYWFKSTQNTEKLKIKELNKS